jgi:hypothetical protein
MNFLLFHVQNLPKNELRAHVDHVHATFDMSILWGPRGHKIDSPYPPSFSEDVPLHSAGAIEVCQL